MRRLSSVSSNASKACWEVGALTMTHGAPAAMALFHISSILAFRRGLSRPARTKYTGRSVRSFSTLESP